MPLHDQVPFRTLPGRKKPKCSSWVTFLRCCVPYVFSGVGPVRVRAALMSMTASLNKFLDVVCDYDPDDPEASLRVWRKMKTSLVKSLCLLERDLPESEFSPFVHQIVHLADSLLRWNNCRNYWCFITERFVGYVKGFVKNRTLPLENLVHTYMQIMCTLRILIVWLCELFANRLSNVCFTMLNL